MADWGLPVAHVGETLRGQSDGDNGFSMSSKQTFGQAAGIEVRRADPNDLSAWEAARAHSRQRDHFNSALLLQDLHRHFLPLCIVECWREGQLIGGCWGWEQKGGSCVRFQPPPSIGQGMVWIRDEGLAPSPRISLCQAVMVALVEWLPRHFDVIDLIAAPELPDTRPFIATGWDLQPWPTFRLPLTDETTLWENLEGKLRRQVKRARRGGIGVELADDAGVLVEMLNEMGRRRNLPWQALEAFGRVHVRRVHEEGRGQLFVARTAEGKPAAALLPVWENRVASLYLGAVSGENGRRGANPLLHWEVIAWLVRQEIADVFDLYGVLPEEVGQFKKQFNAPLTHGSRLLFTASPTLRLHRHFHGLKSSLKHLLRRRRHQRG